MDKPMKGVTLTVSLDDGTLKVLSHHLVYIGDSPVETETQ